MPPHPWPTHAHTSPCLFVTCRELALQRCVARQPSLWNAHVEQPLLAAVADAEAAARQRHATASAAPAPPPGPLPVDALIRTAAARLSSGPAAAQLALLRLQAMAWALAPSLLAMQAAAASSSSPLEAFTADDVFSVLAFLLGAAPTPLRLLLPAGPGQQALPAVGQARDEIVPS